MGRGGGVDTRVGTVTVMTVYLRFDYMEMQGVVAEVKGVRVPPPYQGQVSTLR